MTEAIACGVPVISFDFGAISERIKKYNLGWVIKYPSSETEIAKKIETVLNDKTEYDKVIDNINKYKITTKEMSEKYYNIYNNNTINKGLLSDNIKNNLFKNRVFTTYVSYSDNSWVFNTLKWKFISKIKLPKSVKKIYRKMREKI